MVNWARVRVYDPYEMRRDWDVIRTILLAVEQGDGEKEIPSSAFSGIDESIIAYHMWLMIETGLVEGGGRPPGSMGPPVAFIHRLRWSGHELLDEIRADTAWNRIKETARAKGIDLTVDSIKAVAKFLIERLLGS